MNKILAPILALLFSTLVIAIIPTEAEAAIYEDTLRLHIIAESDSEEDQKLKLKVRDGVLENFGEKLSASGSKEEAEAVAIRLIPEIEELCTEICLKEGFSYKATAEITYEWYDTRFYEDFTLPRGLYCSMKITLGKGEGKNWWCVMYPPLCLDMATAETSEDKYSPEENALITAGGYKIKFKLLELAADLFR